MGVNFHKILWENVRNKIFGGNFGGFLWENVN